MTKKREAFLLASTITITNPRAIQLSQMNSKQGLLLTLMQSYPCQTPATLTNLEEATFCGHQTKSNIDSLVSSYPGSFTNSLLSWSPSLTAPRINSNRLNFSPR
ncbi:hypothetical protein FGO68_gene13181 [Halteria grandinella]|uniref:Uncharacterized protein n=1 Tax=Halteria grandinella TaxID=5974 RepID=A0A8J8NW34_HALGN|nr:hypothetical protein FGO68_gene13181 [Halteria grandinella]